MDVVESGTESMEVVSMILHCWFTNNEEGSLFIPPFVHCLDSLRIGPFGVWPLMRGVVSVAVGAAILLALRKCLRHRRLKAEATRSQDTTSVEINRVDTPTRLNNSSRQLTIIPSPTKASASTVARQTLASPIEVVKMDFKTANDGGDDSDSESESGVIDEVEVMDTTDNAAQAVRDRLLETTTNHTPSPAHHNVVVVDQETETSESTFNLTFTEESDSDTTFDESDSHSITVTNPHSNNNTTTGILRQRMVAGDGEHTMEDDDTAETVVSKAIITVL